jgi:putative lipoic acid-binding regulatory protein
MPKPPPIDLLDATHQFPGPYHLKVIGKSGDDLVRRVLGEVRDEMKLTIDPSHSTRETEGGRHVAVSLELDARSAAQVHAVYVRLLKLPGVILLL